MPNNFSFDESKKAQQEGIKQSNFFTGNNQSHVRQKARRKAVLKKAKKQDKVKLESNKKKRIAARVAYIKEKQELKFSILENQVGVPPSHLEGRPKLPRNRIRNYRIQTEKLTKEQLFWIGVVIVLLIPCVVAEFKSDEDEITSASKQLNDIDFNSRHGTLITNQNAPQLPNPYGFDEYVSPPPPHSILECAAVVLSSNREVECFRLLKPPDLSKLNRAADDVLNAILKRDSSAFDIMFAFSAADQQKLADLVNDKLTQLNVKSRIEPPSKYLPMGIFQQARRVDRIFFPSTSYAKMFSGEIENVVNKRYRLFTDTSDFGLNELSKNFVYVYINGTLDQVTYLLNIGVKIPYFIDPEGYTHNILNFIPERDAVKKATLMIENGVKPDGIDDLDIPLAAVALADNADLFELYIYHSANFAKKKPHKINGSRGSPYHIEMLNSLLDATYQSFTYELQTVFDYAIASGKLATVTYIFENRLLTAFTKMDFMYVLITSQGKITQEQVYYLMEKVPKMDGVFSLGNDAGITLLHYVVALRHDDALRYLFPFVSHLINKQDSNGQTAMHILIEILERLAKNKQRLDHVLQRAELLIHSGLDLWIKDNKGKTARSLLTTKNSLELAKLLDEAMEQQLHERKIKWAKYLLGGFVTSTTLWLANFLLRRRAAENQVRLERSIKVIDHLAEVTHPLLLSKWIDVGNDNYEIDIQLKPPKELKRIIAGGYDSLTVSPACIADKLKTYLEYFGFLCKFINTVAGQFKLQVHVEGDPNAISIKKNRDSFYKEISENSIEYKQVQQKEQERQLKKDLDSALSQVVYDKNCSEQFYKRIVDELKGTKIADEVKGMFTGDLLRKAANKEVLVKMSKVDQQYAKEIQKCYDNLAGNIKTEYENFLVSYQKEDVRYQKKYQLCSSVSIQANIVDLRKDMYRISSCCKSLQNTLQNINANKQRLRVKIESFEKEYHRALTNKNYLVTIEEETIEVPGKKEKKPNVSKSEPIAWFFGKKASVAAEAVKSLPQEEMQIPKEPEKLNLLLQQAAKKYTNQMELLIRNFNANKFKQHNKLDKNVLYYALSYYILKWLDCIFSQKKAFGKIIAKDVIKRMRHGFAHSPDAVDVYMLIDFANGILGVTSFNELENDRYIGLFNKFLTSVEKQKEPTIKEYLDEIKQCVNRCIELKKLIQDDASSRAIILAAIKISMAHIGEYCKVLLDKVGSCSTGPLNRNENPMYYQLTESNFLYICTYSRDYVCHDHIQASDVDEDRIFDCIQKMEKYATEEIDLMLKSLEPSENVTNMRLTLL